MKKVGVFVLGFVFMLVLSGFVFAEMVETSVISSGNGVCEEYNVDMKIGDSDSVILNGESFDFKLLSIEQVNDQDWVHYELIWEVNGERSEGLRNYFYNKRYDLGQYIISDSVRDAEDDDASVRFSEIDGYRWDCLGYNEGRGLYAEVEINEGWNLVSFDSHFRYCDEVAVGEICRDDVLVEYIYFPTINKYYSMEYLEEYYESIEDKYDSEEEAFANDPLLKTLAEYFTEENEMNIQMSSKWIYVKPGSGSRKMLYQSGGSSSRRDDILNPNGDYGWNGLKLFSGWNFMTVNAFMLYDNSWRFDGLSLDDMSGDCNIERSYWFDSGVQNWEQLSPSSKFVAGDIGKGFIVKVSENCYLGDSRTATGPPALPSGDEGCTDSDGGLNYYVKGTTTDAATTKMDSCWSDGIKLSERYCIDNALGVITYECPEGCSDGACVGEGGYLIEEDIGVFTFRNSYDSVETCDVANKGEDECRQYGATYDYSGEGIDVLEVMVEIPSSSFGFNQAARNLKSELDGETTIDDGNWNGNFYWGLTSKKDSQDTVDIFYLWESNGKLIVFHIDDFDDPLIDDNIFNVFLDSYFNKYPSTSSDDNDGPM